MNYQDLRLYISSENNDEFLTKIKSNKEIYNQKRRYTSLLDRAYEKFGEGDYHLIYSPGRVEIGGNHTDHQHGRVIAAALNVDNICVVRKSEDSICTFVDEKHGDVLVNIDNLDIKENERFTSASLIRGIAARLKSLGYKIGGFRAISHSEVLAGKGVSSSACFEMMIVEIFNTLFNDGCITKELKASVGQYSENNYFGKPSGQMDQLSIATGGLVYIDFKNPNEPIIENYDFDFDKYGYDLLLVDTKDSHVDLSNEYASITQEMKQISKYLGVDVLRDGDKDYFFSHLKELRQEVKNDRAILRAIHFFEEDDRVCEEKDAIEQGDVNKLLKLIKDSGRSSYMYLQNVYPASKIEYQPSSIALALSDYILADNGAYRIHGGGFGGTILSIVPHRSLDNYCLVLSSVFGEEAITILKISPFGTFTIV